MVHVAVRSIVCCVSSAVAHPVSCPPGEPVPAAGLGGGGPGPGLGEVRHPRVPRGFVLRQDRYAVQNEQVPPLPLVLTPP